MESLKKADYRAKLRMRRPRVKVFRPAKLHDDLDAVDVTNELLKEITFDGSTDDPRTEADHAEGSIYKFAAFKVHLS